MFLDRQCLSDENKAIVAWMGQGSCAAVINLCCTYEDFSTILVEDMLAECRPNRFF